MAREEWRPFPQAREFVRGLALLDIAEWRAYCVGDMELLLGARPADIPSAASLVYRGDGWSGWRDWLGPPPIEPTQAGFRTFKRARSFARSLKLEDAAAWRSWCAGRHPAQRRRRPADIPEDPPRTYPRAWRGWGDWLGTQRGRPGRGLREYLPFDRARAWARTLGLRSAREWRDVCCGRHAAHEGLLPGVPASPGLIYGNCGWNGYGDWLGTEQYGPGNAPFLPFADAREHVRRLALASTGAYFAWSAGRRPDLPPRPATVPGDPDRAYAGAGWVSWGDFLGTGNVHHTKRVFRAFGEARKFALSLRLKTCADWHAFAAGARADLGEFPIDLPHHPDTRYADDGWKGWGDFLGTGNIAPSDRSFRPFEEARAFARSLRLRSGEEWAAFARGERLDLGPLPPDVPRAPHSTFKDRGWTGWGDFLGSGNRSPGDRRFAPFDEARTIARGLGLSASQEWSAFVRGTLPGRGGVRADLPRNPVRMYAGRGWRGWCDFLGLKRRGRPKRSWRPFEEARSFARGLGFRSSRAWEAWSRGERPDLAPRPADIPGVPYVAYAKDGWRGWRDFIGTDAPAPAHRETLRPRARS